MAKLTERRILYVCTECADTMPECCGYYDPSELVVMPDGRWLCERCFEDERWSLCKDDESFPPLMSEMPHPPIYMPAGGCALEEQEQGR